MGPEALVGAAKSLVAAANKDPDFAGVFTLFNAASPSTFADIDREKAEKLSLTPTDIFSTLQVYLGSQYVNDFNYLGSYVRGYCPGPMDAIGGRRKILRISRPRNSLGQMVPIGSVAQLKHTTIPYRVPRYNLYPAAEVQGVGAPGIASERLCYAWKNWRIKFFQTVSTLSGPSWRFNRKSGERRPCWCLAPPHCSFFWFWLHNTKAGSCLWPSCSSYRCVSSRRHGTSRPWIADRYPGADRVRGSSGLAAKMQS